MAENKNSFLAYPLCLVKQAFFVIAQISLTLLTTILLGYFLLNLGPVNWILKTHAGYHAHLWLMSALGLDGIEDALDSLIILSYSGMLPPSSWLCRTLTQYLQKPSLR